MKSTVDILREARDYIAQPGMWRQLGDGLVHGEFGARCIHLALKDARGDCPLPPPREWWAADAAVSRLLGDPLTHGCPELRFIFEFNDAPGRTLDEVLGLLDQAIANEEAREQEFSVEPVVHGFASGGDHRLTGEMVA